MASLYVKATEAEQILGVERHTIFRWAKAGRIPYIQKNGSHHHWYFDRNSLLSLAKSSTSSSGEQIVQACPVADERIDVIYARVSTRKQIGHLEGQIESLQAKYPSCVVFRDCASGLNFKRKGLLSLLQLVLARRVRVVHVAYRDRLCRFAYDLIEYLFLKHNTTICVEAYDSNAPEHELAEDVIAIITVFGARMYGRRSRSKRQSKEEIQNSKIKKEPDNIIRDDDRPFRPL
jgi:putative resolvase